MIRSAYLNCGTAILLPSCRMEELKQTVNKMDGILPELYDDDGTMINPEFISKPAITCKKEDAGGKAEVLCIRRIFACPLT